jgi:hypothetical protein
VEATVKLRRGQEYEGRHPWWPLTLECWLAGEERPEPLRLRVGEEQGVVEQRPGAVGPFQPPALAVTGQHARPRLDLDKEETAGCDGQQVDLVDRAVLGDELDVSPSPVGLVVGKARSNERERFALVGPGRRPFGPEL